MTRTTLEIEAAEGIAEAYLSSPDGSPDGHPGVLVWMDAIGLRPRLEEMADRIASWGYTVLVPNVFYREGTATEMAPSADLREPGAREAFFEQAMPRVGRLTPDRVRADAGRYLDALAARPQTAPGSVAVVGYCMGAACAVRTAALRPDVVAALGCFHGGRLAVEDDPESPHLLLDGLRAEVLALHADADRSMPPEAVARFARAVRMAGLAGTTDVAAPRAPHGYSMADTSMYHEPATERHFTELASLLSRSLG